MFNYLHRLTVLTMAIFLSCVLLFQFSPLTLSSIVYAAVISCGPIYPQNCDGTEGDDNMKGTSGPDSMNGLGGDDQMSGGPGNDGLHGGYGNDELSGGPGNDILRAYQGRDSFKCGAGNDRILYFDPSEDIKSNDCENIGFGNATGLSNDTLTGFPANQTLNTTNSSIQ